MPETTHPYPPSPDLDEFDLQDLALLAPVRSQGDGLHRAAPQWAEAREEILGRIIDDDGAPAAPLAEAGRRNWLPRLAVAAATALALGGIGFGLLRPAATTSQPAAPVSSSAPAPTVAGYWVTIPAGHYLASTVRVTQDFVEPGGGRVHRSETRTQWVDSSHVIHQRVTTSTGSSNTPTETTYRRDLTGLPGQPDAMRAWFLQHDRKTGESRSDDEVVWVSAADLLRNMETSTALRRDLVAMLRTNPTTSQEFVQQDGRRALRISHTSTDDEGSQVDTITLDASSLALLQNTSQRRDVKGTVTNDFSMTVPSPVKVVSTQP